MTRRNQSLTSKILNDGKNYKKVSDTYAQSIMDAIENSHDINEMRINIHIINMEIQVERFRIIWEVPSKQRKMVKRDSKD